MQNNPVFYATNEDRIYSAGLKKGLEGKTRYMPDVGSLVGSVETITEQKAIKIGKPEKHAFEAIVREHFDEQVDLDSFIMIGDNPESDIKFAQNAGIDSCLVFTGVLALPEDAAGLERLKDEIKPTFMCY